MISLDSIVDSLEHKRKRKASKKKASKKRKGSKRKSRKGGKRKASKKYANVKVRTRFKSGGKSFGCYTKSVKTGKGSKRAVRGYCSSKLG